jgi:protein O-GlcNAc transferase
MNIHQAFEEAVQRHQSGRFGEAEVLYRRIIAAQPDHAEVLHMLGLLAHQSGHHDAAGELMRRALALMPENAACHSNLSDVERVRKRFDEALAACRRAIELEPYFANAHNNLGNVFADMGRPEEAIAAYRRTLELTPEDAEVCVNLGNVLRATDRTDEAIAAFRKAASLQPENAAAHHSLGIVLKDARRMAEAVVALQRAIQLEPEFAEAHFHLGQAFREMDRVHDAIGSFRQAIRFKPDYAEAHQRLGAAFRASGQIAEAIAACGAAIRLKPDFAEAYGNLANALKDECRVEEAVAACRRALQLDPSLSVTHSNLLLCLHYLPAGDSGALFDEHCRWADIHAQPDARLIQPHANDCDPGRRLRIGYVSPDFRQHPVAYFVEGLFASHDSEKAEVFCYADVRRPDAVTERLRELVPHWRDIARVPDERVASLIREDRIDILVDLAGHTANNRLLVFAIKPAPVQVTWLGYCDTTGLRTMDWRFTDAHADPSGSTEQFHTERLFRLPETFASYRPAKEAPAVNPLPALSRGLVTFASFHAAGKLNAPMLECWAEIMRNVSGSRLMFAGFGLDETAIRERLAAFFAERGVESPRLEFRPRRSFAQYLAQHNDVDVLLDCHPFSGHTVSCHALWMGVPVVTLAGRNHCSRMVASVLANVGLPELIAGTPAEYVTTACELAADLQRLAQLRSSLRERMAASPLTDALAFARSIEDAFREMWRGAQVLAKP